MVKLKQLSSGLGVMGVCALLGWFSGGVRGGGNELLLAVCYGCVGAFVGFFGFGPAAGIFAPLARLLGYSRTPSDELAADDVNVTAYDASHGPESRS